MFDICKIGTGSSSFHTSVSLNASFTFLDLLEKPEILKNPKGRALPF
ncbi:MAG: hypothetical protein J6P10_03295 [Aeriscardovia sp.]|nr:hypothetical protein [Aeriscardovia sp.]